ncbi:MULTISPECIES: hypothetical protein [Glaesserella]|uniref:Uncharacterized protein n=1 Tax=Glaesserella australis TaxID=2094024 RepID=A0A328BUP8_9PAST|nr:MULTISPECIES: hypothetical protein [Glaesserella]AUI66703.1 hypothetical protein CJD39_08990 [Glaesserella sp. 15-184]RAL17903.1 hypothetical protein C5N92_10615 [Glaesserella australis]
MILFAKFAISADRVWQMSLIELSAWIESYLEFEGVKQPQKSSHSPDNSVKQESFIFTRRGKIGA